ncbi:MAG TPA: hypothetical protein VJ227_04540 [Patescibacteria group bacterium]|nr:hypothetical protein [Patescibacteria group bacterium]
MVSLQATFVANLLKRGLIRNLTKEEEVFWDVLKPMIAWIVGPLFLYYVGWGVAGSINPVSEERAVTRFSELTQVDSDEIVVVRHSNNNPWLLGNPFEVSFELVVSGEPMSGRCTANLVSPMICLIYDAGGG